MVFARRNPENLFSLLATVILLYFHLRTMAGHYGFLRRPGSSYFVSDKFIFLCNLSCKRKFPVSVGFFGDNKL